MERESNLARLVANFYKNLLARRGIVERMHIDFNAVPSRDARSAAQ